MEINRQNYEQYFIDYLDRKLNPEQVEVLMSFLEFNPDLKEEFSDIEKICLEPDTTYFSGKANLLKSETDLAEATILKDFDMYCISSMEKDIADEEEEILLGIIDDDPDREDTYRLYQSTRLMPDENIHYPGKSRLKKRYINKPYRILLPAAAVAIILIIFQVFTGRGPEVGKLTQTQETPVNTRSNEEAALPLAQESPLAVESPSITGQENPSGTNTVKHTLLFSEESVSAEGLVNAGESLSIRKSIQLARVEPKSIRQVEVRSATFNHTYVTDLERTENVPDQSRNDPRLSLWKLADASVRGLNNIAEDEYHLSRKKDGNGNTRRFTFDSPIFGISAPLRNPDTP